MRPPDQIPNRAAITLKRGDTVFLWNGHRYSEKTFVTQHDWRSAMTLQDGVSQLIAEPEKVISAEQFYEEQREEARERYADVIEHWNAGRRTSIDMALISGLSARMWGQLIAAAKRWELISDDPKPSDSNSSSGG